MTLEERVAQLFMVGTGVDHPDPLTLQAVARCHVGGILLRGRSRAGVQETTTLVSRFTARVPRSGPVLWVAVTDFEPHVVDTQVGQNSPDVDTYRELLARGAGIVMVSTAVYRRIDPSAPAAFSAPVVTDLLRRALHFHGVVMTDDLSATAQVADWSLGARAVLSIRAGVDLLLVSADADAFPPMYRAVLRAAREDPAFAAKVDLAARRIITAKEEFPGPLDR